MSDRTALRATAALTVAVVVVALLVLVLVDPGRLRSVLGGGPASAPTADSDDESDADSVAEPVAGLRETPPPPGPPVTTIDPAHPFAGSPAADYPSGIAGLRLPPAKRVGSFSAKEVGQALGLARRYFAASRLDPEVIAGAYPTDVIALLDPESKDTGLRDALRQPRTGDGPTQYVTRVDPRQDVLHGSVIKVNGTATVRAVSPHELVVTVEALVVYAFRRVDGTPEVTRVVLRVRQELSTFRGMVTTPGTVWRGKSSTTWAGVLCTTTEDGYLHPAYEGEQGQVAGPSADPYDARQPPPDADCWNATRV